MTHNFLEKRNFNDLGYNLADFSSDLDSKYSPRLNIFDLKHLLY